MTLTDKQRRLLQVLEHYDGHGTIEVAINFGEYEADRPNKGDDGGVLADWNLTQFVIGGLVRSLVRKGLARDDADGWGITAAGRAALRAEGLHCECGMCAMAREYRDPMQDDRTKAAQSHPSESPTEFIR